MPSSIGTNVLRSSSAKSMLDQNGFGGARWLLGERYRSVIA
jgi:hypothetical protein